MKDVVQNHSLDLEWDVPKNVDYGMHLRNEFFEQGLIDEDSALLYCPITSSFKKLFVKPKFDLEGVFFEKL